MKESQKTVRMPLMKSSTGCFCICWRLCPWTLKKFLAVRKPVTELIRGNNNYLGREWLFHPVRRLLIRTNNSQLSINIVRTTSKMLRTKRSQKVVEDKEEKYRDKIDYFQFLHFSILYRAFHSSLDDPLAPAGPFFALILPQQKVYYFIKSFSFLQFSVQNNSLKNLKLLIEQQNSITSINLIYFPSLFWMFLFTQAYSSNSGLTGRNVGLI